MLIFSIYYGQYFIIETVTNTAKGETPHVVYVHLARAQIYLLKAIHAFNKMLILL